MQQAEPDATADRQDPTWKKVGFHFALWWLVIIGLGCIVLAAMTVIGTPSVAEDNNSQLDVNCGGSALRVLVQGPHVVASTAEQTQRIERACTHEAPIQLAIAVVPLLLLIPILIGFTQVRNRLGGRSSTVPQLLDDGEPGATADRPDPIWKKVGFFFVLMALVFPGLACIAIAVLLVTEPPWVDAEAGATSIVSGTGSANADCGGMALRVVVLGSRVVAGTAEQTQRIERACVDEARLQVAGAVGLLLTSVALLIPATLIRDRYGGRNPDAPLIPY
jgi:hypothetical protein